MAGPRRKSKAKRWTHHRSHTNAQDTEDSAQAGVGASDAGTYGPDDPIPSVETSSISENSTTSSVVDAAATMPVKKTKEASATASSSSSATMSSKNFKEAGSVAPTGAKRGRPFKKAPEVIDLSDDEESETAKAATHEKETRQKRSTTVKKALPEPPKKNNFKIPHKSNNWKRHFYYHGPNAGDDVAWEREVCHWCQIHVFSTRERYPISITNTVDTAELPYNFRFIEQNVLDKDVHPADDEFRIGCECSSRVDCQYAGCHCLQDMDFEEGTEEKVYSYHSTGRNAECLRSVKLNSRDPIYECHGSCNCGKNCVNRVVERGRKIPLNIFRTEDNRGWGVRSDYPIQKGQFIDCYFGHVITNKEANIRRAESNVAQRKDVYLFALDKFSDPASMDPRLAGPPYEIDGEFMSGPTRFINHSCDPNLRIFARVGDHADKHIHDLAFFAIKDIPKRTELTFDYVDGGQDSDSQDREMVKDMTECLCGSKNCRGYLW